VPEEKTHSKNKTHGKWWEFAVCHDEHTVTWFVCRVPNVWHTANRWPRRAVCLTVGFAVRFNWHTAIKIYASVFLFFAVCLSVFLFFSDSSPCARGLGTRRTNYLRRVPEIVAHGEFIPTLSGSGHAVFLLFYAVYLDKHTAKLFAVCLKFGTRQTRPLPCL